MTESEFRAAFFAHKDVLYRFAYRMTGTPHGADDIVQDSFLALWRKPAAYDPDRGSLRSFLLGIARNLALKRWRSEHPHDDLEEDSSTCEPVDLVGCERAEIVARAVEALPPLQREALILAEYEDLSLDEIAAATDSAVTAVKARLHRARTNLRRVLHPLLDMKGTSHGTI